MNQKPRKNMAASVHQRLKNAAVASGERFNDLQQNYAIERFLYRFSISPHSEQFILKGALLLRVWNIATIRPTRDIDLLGLVSNDQAMIRTVVRDICLIAVEDDGLVFDPTTITIDPISPEAEYEGVRSTFAGKLGNARIAMQIDFGFGDRITPPPRRIVYPSVLGMAGAKLKVYPPETSIAEKFHVMLQRGSLNSRMKDFFDIWTLSRSRVFEGKTLGEAIVATCAQRGTTIDPVPIALTPSALENERSATQWSAFRRRLGNTETPETFADVGAMVASFLKPVIHATATGEVFEQVWTPPGPWRSMNQ